MTSEDTRDRILRAFLSLAAERGMAVVTTRDIAAAAGVNEVTIFRHFGGKASLAREAVRRFHPAAAIEACDPAIDAATPQRVLQGLLRCLGHLRSQLASHPELLQFGLGEATRYPELLDDLRQIPAAARHLLTRAFEQASSQLRDDVSIDAEVIGFLGMLLMLAAWRSRHWVELSEDDITGLLAARLRPLLREPVDTCQAASYSVRRSLTQEADTMPAVTEQPVIAACSFCLKPNTEVAALVAGPGVYICNECVGLCEQIIATKPDAGPRPEL